MEVSGKIKVIDSTKEVGTSGFKKRDVVVTTDEQYPQDIQVQFVQDKCDVLDGYKAGQDVTIGINLRGRMWTNPEGKEVYFNTIQGWNIKAADTSKQSPEPQAPNAPFPTAPALNEEEPDNLPF